MVRAVTNNNYSSRKVVKVSQSFTHCKHENDIHICSATKFKLIQKEGLPWKSPS